MAKTAVLNKETQDLIGIGQSPSTSKLVYEGAGFTEDQVVLVTAKDFTASERYPSFKEMCMTQAERDEAAKKADEKAKADAQKAADKEAKDKERAEKKAAKEAAGGEKAERKPRGDALTGDYHLTKALPPCAADHPKFPIWEAIANNTNVEAAKAACPEVNPPRKTNGVYTFASEFRYFLRTGYAKMGQPGQDEPEADKAAEQEAGAEEAAAEGAAA